MTHLLVAYVNHQLERNERILVLRHVQQCATCRAALGEHERLVSDLKATFSMLGQPTGGQLARLWPAVRSGISLRDTSRPRSFAPTIRRLPTASSLALVLVVVAAFASSMVLHGPRHAVAAPLPPVPAEHRSTATPAPGGMGIGTSTAHAGSPASTVSTLSLHPVTGTLEIHAVPVPATITLVSAGSTP